MNNLFQLCYKNSKYKGTIRAYATFYRYKIPIVVQESPVEDIRDPKIELNFSMIQNLRDLSEGYIIIGSYYWDNANIEDIINVCYHEIAHMLYPFYFDESHADEFAVAHIGATAYINSLVNLDKLVHEYFEKFASNISYSDINYRDYYAMNQGRYERIISTAKRIKTTARRRVTIEMVDAQVTIPGGQIQIYTTNNLLKLKKEEYV